MDSDKANQGPGQDDAPALPTGGKIRPPGSIPGISVEMADDFDAPLPEFADYMGEDKSGSRGPEGLDALAQANLGDREDAWR